MQKHAVIDIGSNSVRLMLAEVEGNDIARVYKWINTTRIAEGLAATGMLDEHAMRRSASAVADFKKQADEWGALQPVRCYATSAVREAANGGEFMAMLSGIGGLVAEVIDGKFEAECAYVGASRGGLPVLDVGGASTELILDAGGGTKACSVHFGCVMLKEMFTKTDPISDSDKAAMDEYCAARVKELLEGSGACCYRGDIVGVGGTATQLAMLHLALPQYDADVVNGCHMDIDEVGALYDRLAAMTVAQKASMVGMGANRADIILPGAAIIYAVLKALGGAGLYASDGDGLEGYLKLRVLS